MIAAATSAALSVIAAPTVTRELADPPESNDSRPRTSEATMAIQIPIRPNFRMLRPYLFFASLRAGLTGELLDSPPLHAPRVVCDKVVPSLAEKATSSRPRRLPSRPAIGTRVSLTSTFERTRALGTLRRRRGRTTVHGPTRSRLLLRRPSRQLRVRSACQSVTCYVGTSSHSKMEPRRQRLRI